MGKLLSAITQFIKTAIMLSMLGSGVCLVAGEVRLAALKQASKGSTKLSGFTQRMTKTKGF